MLDGLLTRMIDTSLVLFGGLVLLLLYAANEIGFRAGLWRSVHRPAQDRDLAGIGTITAGMLGLLAFTLSLTINIAQNRFELRRSFITQDANAIEAAWLRSKLINSEEGPVITALIEAFAKVQLAYVSADTFDVEAAGAGSRSQPGFDDHLRAGDSGHRNVQCCANGTLCVRKSSAS
jgi:hypothetical protein